MTVRIREIDKSAPIPTVSAIAAIDKNHLIGIGMEMPWHLPVDFKYFKTTTMNHPIIMGRISFESIGSRPLKGRPFIIVSTNAELSYDFDNVYTVTTVEDAIALSRTLVDYDTSETFICGGGQIYAYALKNKLVDKLYITNVDAKIKVDEWDEDKCVYFPQYGNDAWDLVSVDTHKADEKNKYDMSFLVLQRNF